MGKTFKTVSLAGVVQPFSGNGRQLGYPTANIRSTTGLSDGVYFGLATMDDFGDWPALIFIGTPITVGDRERRVEAHLLDIPDMDYYGSELALTILHFHRSNRKLDSVEELQRLMAGDEKAARAWFARQRVAGTRQKGDN